jgi:hypothetical protein
MIGKTHLLIIALVVFTSAIAGASYTHMGGAHSPGNAPAININTVVVNATFPIPAGTSYRFNESYWPVPVFSVGSYGNVTISWTSDQNVTPIIIGVNSAWNPANSSLDLMFVPSAHSGVYLPPSLYKLPVPSTSGSYVYSLTPGKYMILMGVPNPVSVKDGFTITFSDGIGQ